MGNESLDHDKLARRFQLTLRRHKELSGHTAKTLGDALGIDARTVETHLSGQRPYFNHLFAYIQYFGATFANEVLSCIGISGASDVSDGPVNAHRLIAELTSLSSMVARAMEDGHLDHREIATIRPAAVEAQTALAGFCKKAAQ